METKVCSKCKKEKPIGEFSKDKGSKDGLHSWCKECRSEYRKQTYIKKGRVKLTSEERKIRMQLRHKKYCEINKEKIKENQKKYRRERKIKFKKENPALYKIIHSTSNLILYSLKKINYKKNKRTQKILGCTFEEFKIYIESKFEPWMNWDNHGVYTGKKNETWQLDHITPMASAKTIEDVIRLNHYTNFQPLDSYINQVIKRDKIDWI